MSSHRTFGLSLLSFSFAWLAVAGFAYGVLAIQQPNMVAAFGIQPRIISVLAFAYGVSAAAVAAAAWRRAEWLPRAVALWGATLIIMFIAFQAMIGIAGEPLLLVLAPYPVFVLLIWLLFRFAASKVRDSHAT